MSANGAIGVSPNFEWKPDYDELLEKIASSDYDEKTVEWNVLRDVIKYRLEKIVDDYLENSNDPPPELPQSSQEPSSTPTPTPKPSTTGGLRLPPFPKREQSELAKAEFNARGRHKAYLSKEEAHAKRDAIFAQVHDFEGHPPFTIQRLGELITRPRAHYKSIGKYLRAVERSLLVTSTSDAFPPVPADDTISDVASISMLSASGSLREATTPLFSPIPFIHDDARRSRSRSPPMSPLDLAAKRHLSPQPTDITALMHGADPIVLEGDGPVIGLVDELDDPSPGHLSDHPTALSATTTVTSEVKPVYGSLEERFVKSSASEENGNGGQSSLTAQPEGETESDDMVLDDPDGDHDKENKNKP